MTVKTVPVFSDIPENEFSQKSEASFKEAQSLYRQLSKYFGDKFKAYTNRIRLIDPRDRAFEHEKNGTRISSVFVTKTYPLLSVLSCVNDIPPFTRRKNTYMKENTYTKHVLEKFMPLNDEEPTSEEYFLTNEWNAKNFSMRDRTGTDHVQYDQGYESRNGACIFQCQDDPPNVLPLLAKCIDAFDDFVTNAKKLYPDAAMELERIDSERMERLNKSAGITTDVLEWAKKKGIPVTGQ